MGASARAAGAGIHLTVVSNMGTMNFGVLADGNGVPDVCDIADGFGEAISALRKAAETSGRVAAPAG